MSNARLRGMARELVVARQLQYQDVGLRLKKRKLSEYQTEEVRELNQRPSESTIDRISMRTAVQHS